MMLPLLLKLLKSVSMTRFSMLVVSLVVLDYVERYGTGIVCILLTGVMMSPGCVINANPATVFGTATNSSLVTTIYL